MRRYSPSPAIIEKITKTIKHRTSFCPKIKLQDSDSYIRSRAGDRLDNLAFEFYSDVSLWWIIATANNIGKGSFAVKPGTKLRIPRDISQIIEDYRNFNEFRR
tara:strand:- start:66 stop:374 length:309 start_codon:yes stop_codon:yes gene_type:complete